MKHKSLLEHTIFTSYSDELNLIAKILLDTKRNSKKPEFSEKQILVKDFFNCLTEMENKQKDIQIAKLFLKSPNTIGRKNRNYF